MRRVNVAISAESMPDFASIGEMSGVSATVFELLRTFEVDLEIEEDAWPVRIELYRDKEDEAHFRARVWLLETFRIQPTFPQREDGLPQDDAADEDVLVEWSYNLGEDFNSFSAESEEDVEVGPDTVIHPGVILEGQTKIGAACEIHGHVRICDSVLAERVTVNNFCLIVGARVADGATVGPFAHLRPDSEVGEGAKIGNFVELKKTTMGPGSKANHLAYVGDATVGERVNIGAGTIIANYDGVNKHRTVIENDVHTGSNSVLVAPIKASTLCSRLTPTPQLSLRSNERKLPVGLPPGSVPVLRP